MTAKQNGADAAFPKSQVYDKDADEFFGGQKGMTKREAMAMHIMAGFAKTEINSDRAIVDYAGRAVKAADALLEALQQ